MGEKAARFALQAGFVARYGQVLGLPDADGNITTAVLGVPEAADGAEPFVFGVLPDSLPSGLWRISAPEDVAAADMALGFCLGAYRMPAFGRDVAPKPRGRGWWLMRRVRRQARWRSASTLRARSSTRRPI